MKSSPSLKLDHIYGEMKVSIRYLTAVYLQIMIDDWKQKSLHKMEFMKWESSTISSDQNEFVFVEDPHPWMTQPLFEDDEFTAKNLFGGKSEEKKNTTEAVKEMI